MPVEEAEESELTDEQNWDGEVMIMTEFGV